MNDWEDGVREDAEAMAAPETLIRRHRDTNVGEVGSAILFTHLIVDPLHNKP